VSPDLALSELSQGLGQIALAALLGGLIGIERRLKGQSAGMRTQMVLSAACCIAMQISRYMPRISPGSDPGHMAQSVLQGIGFLGAGVILKTGLSVHGLTTAVSIWATATLGLCVGAGLLVHALALTLLSTAGLLLLQPVENLLTGRRELRRIVVESGEMPDPAEPLRSVLQKHGVQLDELGIARNLESHRMVLNAVTSCPENLAEAALVSELCRLPGVVEVRVE